MKFTLEKKLSQQADYNPHNAGYDAQNIDETTRDETSTEIWLYR